MKDITKTTSRAVGAIVVFAAFSIALVAPGLSQNRLVKQLAINRIATRQQGSNGSKKSGQSQTDQSQSKDFRADLSAPEPLGKIAFASDRDGNFEIYVMNPDGSGLSRLTDNAAEDTSPSWSPDGRRLAFVSNRDGNKEIYVVGAEGGGLTRLTNNAAEDLHPAWAPSLTNSQIAFVSHRDGNDEIYIMNADGTSQTNLSQNLADDTEPTWAPSGTLLAFSTNRDGDKFEIYRMNSDGSNPVRLTNNGANDVSPTWPPGRITFQTDRDGNDEIYTMNALDGTNQTRVTNNVAFDLDPARSSDGARLVFVSNRDASTNLEIYAANSDGSNVMRLTDNDASDIEPAIQPLPSVATLGSIQLSAAAFSVGEGQGTVDILVTRTGGTGAAVVNIATVDGTALQRTDFTSVFRTLSFAPGETSKTVTISIIDDTRIEGDETFTVTLSGPVNTVLGSPANAVMTIVDNDSTVSATIFGVTAANNLVRFNSATPGTIDSTVAITGLQAGETVLGIDVRPVTRQLYALGSTGRLYILNRTTAAATQVGSGTFAVLLDGTSFGFDFNPVPDRIRVVSDAEQNLRLNPDSGAVVDSDPGTAGVQPDPSLNPAGNVVAVAYTNNFPGATTTTLFGIDSSTDMLVRIGGPDGNPSPNLGVVTNIGPLGVDTSDVVGFDIANPAAIAYALLTVGGNSQLYTINLTTGAATLVGIVGGSSTIGAVSVASPLSNPIDDAEFFVRQHYLDFLNREPDAEGLTFWTKQITDCGGDAACIDRQRVGVSLSFFQSVEFQETGGFVIRVYQAAFNRQPTYLEFVRDRSGLIAGGDLEANKLPFLSDEFVTRSEFTSLYSGLSNAQYVDALNTNSGNSLTTSQRDALVAGLNNGTETRASVLRQVADNAVFRLNQFNSSFVLMEYFGYLRRDIDPGGFAFWLDNLNNLGNFRGIVCAFVTSAEYQDRFSPVRTRNDSICGSI